VAAVPLAKLREFRLLCRQACAWYKTHEDWAEFSDETEIQLDRSGDLCAVRGSLLYRLEQRCRRWRVARLDSETDPSTVDCQELRSAWEARRGLAISIEAGAGGRVWTIGDREDAEAEQEREAQEASLRNVIQDSQRV
jgi:hypothetical protein